MVDLQAAINRFVAVTAKSVIEITARCAGSEASSHIFDTTNNADHEEQPMSLLEANDNGDAGELSAHEIDAVSGGKVLEIPIGSVTIQLNFDNGCWAVWNGKDFVGGG